MCKHFPGKVYMLPSLHTYPQIIDISHICKILGDDICESLIGLHCFTGCDTCSAFKRKGKMKALNLMKTSKDYINAFQKLGLNWDINIQSYLFPTFEKFVCALYGQDKHDHVNDARYAIFKLKFKTGAALPPNYDALLCHLKRANYQACVHRRCLERNILAPSPHGYGWSINDNNLTIQWHTQPYRPDSLFKNVSCSCKKTSCLSNKCSCKGRGIQCSEWCACAENCQNMKINQASPSQPEFEDCTLDYDSDSDY